MRRLSVSEYLTKQPPSQRDKRSKNTSNGQLPVPYIVLLLLAHNRGEGEVGDFE
jgi:hypothetical protein